MKYLALVLPFLLFSCSSTRSYTVLVIGDKSLSLKEVQDMAFLRTARLCADGHFAISAQSWGRFMEEAQGTRLGPLTEYLIHAECSQDSRGYHGRTVLDHHRKPIDDAL